MGRRVGIIGTVIKDTIHYMDGQITHALGGVLYTILPMRVFLPEDYELTPIMHVGQDLHSEVTGILECLPNVKTSNVISEECENNRVDLYYHSREDRTEVATGGVSPVNMEEIKNLDEVDILVVNFISGWEISLSTMKKLCSNLRTTVYSDIHSLTLGKGDDGKRFPRKPYGWRKWLETFHYVQMNENEASTLTGVEIANSEEGRRKSLAEISSLILANGPKTVAITLGARGAFITMVNGYGQQTHEWEDGYSIEEAVDPTGSGDVFLAAFTSALLLGNGFRDALSFSVKASALSTTTRGAEGLYEYYMETGLRP
jgi:hypothetical protein